MAHIDMDKVWEIKDPDALLQKQATRRITKQMAQPRREEKNPGRAYSLSMLHWGGGQLYNDQSIKGMYFLFMMVILAAGTALAAIYVDELLEYLRSHGISTAEIFLGTEALVFCILLFWTYNAGDAYHGAARSRRTPFPGISSRVLPVLASLAVPGWGQFLNGQQVKGSVYTAFAVLGYFSLFSLGATLLAWPSLEPSDARFIVESLFALSLCAAPIFPPVWALSVHDAFKVSGDDLKKEPLWERIKAAYYRGRSQGWVRGVFPHFRLTLMLILFLVFLALVFHDSFARGFYVDWLMHISSYLSSQGMTIMPELISRILGLLAYLGK